jgi:hypothetical protein
VPPIKKYSRTTVPTLEQITTLYLVHPHCKIKQHIGSVQAYKSSSRQEGHNAAHEAPPHL